MTSNLGLPHLLFGGQCVVGRVKETFESVIADHVHVLWGDSRHRSVYIARGFAGPRAVIAHIFESRAPSSGCLRIAAGVGGAQGGHSQVADPGLPAGGGAEAAHPRPPMPPLEEKVRPGPFLPAGRPLRIPSMTEGLDRFMGGYPDMPKGDLLAEYLTSVDSQRNDSILMMAEVAYLF